jgi:hypothetical protein
MIGRQAEVQAMPALLSLAGLLLAAPAVPPAPRVLVGVEYFAGWWESLPNKWHGHGWSPAEPDWRPLYPDRVPLCGDYNVQATMDREIVAAADGGVDFFSILYYFPQTGAGHEAEAELLNRGLATFLASPQAPRLRFMVEYCNAAGFAALSDADWTTAVGVWMAALRHPSALRVDGRLVFKIHDIGGFVQGDSADWSRSRRRLAQLRRAVRDAGLGEMLIGGGVMSRSEVWSGHPAVKLCDFTATYMSIPEVAVRPAEHPYTELAAEARWARGFHAKDPVPWVPYLAAGWNPRPWTHPEADPNHRRFFTFPTRDEWTAELRAVRDDFGRYPSLGLPLADGGRQPVFTIYAWNEFGEGGILAPTAGRGRTLLDAVREVFGPPPPA